MFQQSVKTNLTPSTFLYPRIDSGREMAPNVAMSFPMNRRAFVRLAALGVGTACAPFHLAQAASRRISPNEKLNLAVIGVAGQGAHDLAQLESENIVA